MKKKKEPNMKDHGISIISHKIEKRITEEDLVKDLVKKVGNKIDVKIDNDEKNNY